MKQSLIPNLTWASCDLQAAHLNRCHRQTVSVIHTPQFFLTPPQPSVGGHLHLCGDLSHVFVVSECHVHTRVLVNEGALYSCGYSVFAPTRPGLTGFFVGLFVPWPFSPSPAQSCVTSHLIYATLACSLRAKLSYRVLKTSSSHQTDELRSCDQKWSQHFMNLRAVN